MPEETWVRQQLRKNMTPEGFEKYFGEERSQPMSEPSEVGRLLDQLEEEQSKRRIAEQHYLEAVRGGDALADEVRRLRDENARLRASLGARLEPNPL